MSARNICLVCIASAFLASCDSFDMRNSLGLTHKAPDEFRVYARPPLTVPPDFTLRAPTGASTTATGTAPVAASAQAHSVVIGSTEYPVVRPAATADTAVSAVSSSDLPTGADAQFLQNAGAQRANPQVRSLIQQENSDGSVTPKSSSYLINPTADGEPTVDAAKEAERLKQNKAENKPVTTGDTPTVEPQSKGLWGTISDIF